MFEITNTLSQGLESMCTMVVVLLVGYSAFGIISAIVEGVRRARANKDQTDNR